MAREAGANNLKVRRGELVRAEHHNALAHLAEQLTIGRGRVKGRQDSGGFIARLDPRVSVSVSHAWKAVLEEDDDKLWLRFLVPSHVSGIVPEIEGVAIDDVQEDGEPPRLEIPASAFAKKGRSERALVLLRYDLRREDFTLEKVVPIASDKPLGVLPWKWHKLLGYVVRQNDEVKWWPQAFFPLAFDVSNVNPQTGHFKPWPRLA